MAPAPLATMPVQPEHVPSGDVVAAAVAGVRLRGHDLLAFHIAVLYLAQAACSAWVAVPALTLSQSAVALSTVSIPFVMDMTLV